VDEHERTTLTASGWAEVCSAAGGATAFCGWGGDANGMAPNASSYARGPFLLHGLPMDGPLDGGGRGEGGVGTLSVPCYRCIAAAAGGHRQYVP
jgi:hypothetical protein